MRRLLYFIPLLLAMSACVGKKAETQPVEESHPLPDTLRVATLYSPTSYFMYREDTMGYDYNLVSSFVKDKGIAMELHVAKSLADAMAMLDSGIVDLVSYEVPITSEYKDRAYACGPVNTTTQVLVQPVGDKHRRITDVTELIGQDIYVEDNSKYMQRINNLNDELGGGINIHPVERDTLITEDLIEMVSKGEIPLTIVDSDIARINKTYYPDLDITLPLSFPQRSAWAVSNDNKWLADSIDAWFDIDAHHQENDMLLKRYFELSKVPYTPHQTSINFRSGRFSPYDDMFKSYTRDNSIDWRLLAAIGYCESQYRNDAVSWAGARGLMQIMPSTARAYGVSPDALVDPDVSIRTAAKIFQSLDNSLKNKVKDPKERVKFILASYNAGLGHVFDAIEIAKDTGKNPEKWYGNVEAALQMKSNPEYYNKPYCRNGYFKSTQTVNYVHKVMDVYNQMLQNKS